MTVPPPQQRPFVVGRVFFMCGCWLSNPFLIPTRRAQVSKCVVRSMQILTQEVTRLFKRTEQRLRTLQGEWPPPVCTNLSCYLQRCVQDTLRTLADVMFIKNVGV